MSRLFPALLATSFFLVATPASACMPDAINFATGSTRLSAEDPSYVSLLAARFREAPRGARLRLFANTDRTGAADANARLARRRGEAVKAAFARHGIPVRLIDVETSVAATSVPNDNLEYVQIDIVASHFRCGG